MPAEPLRLLPCLQIVAGAQPLSRFRMHSWQGFLRGTVVLLQHSQDFYTGPHCGADCLIACPTRTNWGLIMTIGSLKWTEQTRAIKGVLATNDVRTLIANHLGVSVSRVTDEAHFTDDLGADWLDRLELMMAVEDQFAGMEITDDDVNRIELVGDLIRHIETWDNERQRRGAAQVFRNLFGPHVARVLKPAKQQESCGA